MFRLFAVLALLLLLSVPVLAVGKNSIALASVSGSSTFAAALSQPSYGSTVSFAVTTSEAQPFVNVQCVQGGALVYAATRAYWGTYERSFTLAQPLDSNGWGWTGGAASCTAGLWKWGNGSKLLASTSFSVAP